ncbi:MAG: leucine-rich repeat domain-containing protein [Clostridia bacterium]|nr:leucine-rich repeat domain-containing protein [Clostridia bacterium]
MIKIEKKEVRQKLLLLGSVILFAIIFILIVPEFRDTNDVRYTYHILEDGTISIEGCKSAPSKLTVPESIDGYTVTEIYSNAFSNSDSLKTITLPATVKRISAEAFYNCQKLKKVTLNEGIEFIGEEAFAYCSYLKEINLPKSLKIIGSDAFACCTRLASIKIPSNVGTIGDDAFMSCEMLVMDVSENQTAAEYAERYSIPTGYNDSMKSYYVKLGIALAGAAVVIAGVITAIKIIKKRKP